jgi:predicted signal transduction protein with EAL and GGDEF domain
MPADVLRVPEAADNLGVLAEMGVRTALDDFGLCPDGLAAAEGRPLHAIRVAKRLVHRQAKPGYVAALLRPLRDTGAVIVVDGVDTAAQATWWRDAGADLATGPHFGADQTAAAFQSAFISPDR